MLEKLFRLVDVTTFFFPILICVLSLPTEQRTGDLRGLGSGIFFFFESPSEDTGVKGELTSAGLTLAL